MLPPPQISSNRKSYDLRSNCLSALLISVETFLHLCPTFAQSQQCLEAQGYDKLRGNGIKHLGRINPTI